LNVYNETLGDTLGKTDNLGVAEDRLNKKAEAYIKVARLKAEANILIAKAAEAAAKGSTAGLEDQTSFWDKIVISFNSAVFGVAAGATKAIESQIEGVKDAQNEAVVVSDALNKLAKQRADEAARISQEAGLITPGQDKPTGAKTDPAIENTKRLQEELNKITRENETKRRLEAIASEEEKEKELVRINLEYEKKRIEKTKADAQVKKALVIQLEAEAQSKIQEITKKYDDRREQAVKEVEAKIAAIREENALASINNEYDKREELIRKRENALIEEIKNNATLTETERQKAIIAVIDAFTPQYKKNDGDRLISGLNVNNELMNSDTIFFGKRATDLKQDAAKLKEWLDSGKITIEQYKTAIKSIGQAQDDNFKAGLRFYGELAQSLSQLVGGLADDEGKSAAKRKRLQVQAAIINTLGGIAIALGSAEPPRNFIQAAIVGAAGFLNVAKIKSTPITDGTKTYDGGGGGGATPSAPVNVAPALTQSLLGQATTQNVRVVNQQNQAVVRAYVTQDDLKRSQDKSDFLNKLSSF
jgi:hypothetical protein